MKKKVLIIGVAISAFYLTAYSFTVLNNTDSHQEESSCVQYDFAEYKITNPYQKQTEPDFFYEVDSRFIATITKENLNHAKVIADLVPEGATENMDSFQEVNVVLHLEDEKKIEIGMSDVLTSGQIELLKSAEYSTNFNIEAFCKYNNPKTGKTEKYCFVYYVTIIPEKETEYRDGHSALINYLQENSKKEIRVSKKDRLQAGKACFTVTKDGKIKGVRLESTSGYADIDNTMLRLLGNLPGEWVPATNEKGVKVEQELVFSFGLVGC